jgi:hypothetical protein
MLAHAFSYAANDEQRLDAKLEDALLQEAPDLAGSVLGLCRAANNAGHPEVARELLAYAVQLARTIKDIDDKATASGT